MRYEGKPGPWPPVMIAALLFCCGAMTMLGLRTGLLAAGVYCVASGIAFTAYWVDKWAARDGRQRTPESTLHLLALAGGWPGAWFAQTVLRHKSVKPSFRKGFYCTVALNCAALGWLLTENGRTFVRLMSSM